jgi:hypothetical protein
MLGKLYQLCHLNNTCQYLKQYVISFLSIIFELSSEIAVSRKPFETGHMYVHIHLLLRMADRAAPLLRWLVAGFHVRWPGFQPDSGNVGFVVDEVALGQFFSGYFGFPCQLSFHRLLHIHHHLSSGAGTIG